MKIVVLSSYAPSLINFRGRLIEDMVAAGHEVVACAPGDDPESSRRSPNAARATAGADRADRAQPARRRLASRGLTAPAATAAAGPAARLHRTSRYLWRARGPARRRAEVFAMITGLGYAFGEAGRRQPASRADDHDGCTGGLRQPHGVLSRTPTTAMICAASGWSDRTTASDHRRHRHRPRPFASTPVPAGPPVFLLIARLLRTRGSRNSWKRRARLGASVHGSLSTARGSTRSRPR